MWFFDTEKGVQEYIKMAEGYDGVELIRILQKYLPANSTVLELGMGPGKDMDILKKLYIVTGSVNSQIFLDKYKKNNPDADLLLLDATINKQLSLASSLVGFSIWIFSFLIPIHSNFLRLLGSISILIPINLIGSSITSVPEDLVDVWARDGGCLFDFIKWWYIIAINKSS